jgi:ribose 5-phosphate isomerase B
MTTEARSPNTILVPRRAAIGLANDHAGFLLKAFVKSLLAEHCDRVVDVGVDSEQPVDFPDITRKAAALVLDGAAVCHDTYVARQAVEHDDVNVLCIGAWIVGQQIAADVIRTFLASDFSTEEHFRRRVQKLTALERESAIANTAR